MILHPTVQELTNMKKVNRYTAVIAAAKGARYIVNQQNREREEAELLRDITSTKDIPAGEGLFDRESKKAVSMAVEKLVNDDFKIVLPDSTPTK